MNFLILHSFSISLFSIIFILLILSQFLSLGLSVYALRIRGNMGAFLFGLLMLIISFWVLLKIISLFSSTPYTRLILHNINLLIITLIVPFIFLVAVFHTNIPKWFKNKHIIILFIFPAITYILVFISSYYNFLYYDFKIVFYDNIPTHIFKKKFFYHLLNSYNYVLIVSSFVILITSLKGKSGYFRKQTLLFIVGLLIPVIYDISYILEFSPIKDYNLAPVFLSVGNIFVAWSMFGYRFLKIIPVARNLIIDNLSDIMIIIGHDKSIIDINKSGELFFDCKKDKITGISFFEFFQSYNDLTELVRSKKSSDEIVIQKNGVDLSFSITLNRIEDIYFQGEIYIILLHNITDRIKAESEIKRLSVGIEQSPVTIVITDINGNIEYVNPAFSRITGYSAQEAIGNNPRVLKGLTPPEVFEDLWNTVLSGKVWSGEFINKKKSGEHYYEEAVIAPIKNKRDEIVNFIAIKNDITKRKKAEEKLKISEVNLKSAQSIGNVGHWEYNNINGNLFWSEQMFRIYEVSPDEFVPRYDNVVALFHHEDRQKVEEEFALSVQNRTRFEIQHRIVTPKGKVKYIIERSFTNYDENGNALTSLGSVADITQSKLVEQELSNERALLRSLIDTIPDLIFVKDLKGAYLIANIAFDEFCGLSNSEIIGKTDFDFLKKSEAEQFWEVDEFVIGQEKTYVSEDNAIYPDGEKVWFETRKTPFYGADGKITGLIGVGRNITQRKKHEDALRESQANLLSLVENTADNIWAIDPAFRLIFVNKKFREAFKLSYGIELSQGINIIESIPEQIRDTWKERYIKALNNERFVFEEHFEFSGIHFYYEIAMNPIVAGNKVIGVSVFSRDISERKNTENQLKQKTIEIEAQNEELSVTNIALHQAKAQAEESEELFKQLMSHSPVFIFIKDMNLRAVRLSNNYQTLLGVPVYKQLGKTNEELWPLKIARTITEEDLQALNAHVPLEIEFEADEKYYTAIKFPILIEGKPRYLAGFLLDITERKRAENKIQIQNKELFELNATKDKFFSIIAHDLRSPFNAIIGFSEHLVNNLDDCTPEEIKLFASNINISAVQTYKLLENLLEWSRIQRGAVKAEIETQNLFKLVNEMISLVSENAKSKNITLNHSIDPGLEVECDTEMTKTIFRNLISNAIKFTRKSGSVSIGAKESGGVAEINITDNGVGIPADKIPYIFSIEKNTSTRGTENEAGTGLGLVLCKELIEKQGGNIRVESKENLGSTFYITLGKVKS